MKTLLWLDDIRDPFATQYVPYVQIFSPIEKPFNIVWVKNYEEFTLYIKINGLPDAVSFDHDLADEHYLPSLNHNDYKEKTGYECAKWLVNFCLDRNLDLPKFASHSANGPGRENILGLLSNYQRSRKESN